MTLNMAQTEFDIIRFTADSKQFYPSSMKRENWMPASYVKHTKIDIPLGKSRYGGPVIDMPKGMVPPKNTRFACQLDLSEFAPFDKTGLLPKTGQLLFFADILHDNGKVIYADVANTNLNRIVIEHEDNFFSGVLIDKIFAETESFEERFYEPDEDEKEYANEDGKVWDYFAGTEKSKIFGIYTNCQYGPEEIEEIMQSGKLLLLQIGENGFNDEGVFSVLIDKKNLENKIFDDFEFSWGQS